LRRCTEIPEGPEGLGEDIEADLDPKILDKATFTTSKRCFEIATDDKKEYEEWGKEHERYACQQSECIVRFEESQKQLEDSLSDQQRK
jgi:hypothetical protein